jgi:hypothetical protein
VVTSDFHMPRSRAIFETCFGLAGAALWDDPGRCRSPGFGLHPRNQSPAQPMWWTSRLSSRRPSSTCCPPRVATCTQGHNAFEIAIHSDDGCAGFSSASTQRRTRECFRRRCWRRGRPVKRCDQFNKGSVSKCAVL